MGHWPIFAVLSHASWPHLRALSLSGPSYSPGEFAKFVMAHGSIEELMLQREMGCDWQQLEQALAESLSLILPRLKKLECSLSTTVALLFRPQNALEELLGVDLYGESGCRPSPQMGMFLERLSACRSWNVYASWPDRRIRCCASSRPIPVENDPFLLNLR